jgi:hypothetical protein
MRRIFGVEIIVSVFLMISDGEQTQIHQFASQFGRDE